MRMHTQGNFPATPLNREPKKFLIFDNPKFTCATAVSSMPCWILRPKTTSSGILFLGHHGRDLFSKILLLRHADWHHFFYRTATGVELDLIMEKGRRKIALECKASTAPKPSKGFWQALEDLSITEAWIISPINGTYPIEKNVKVGAISDFLRNINN